MPKATMKNPYENNLLLPQRNMNLQTLKLKQSGSDQDQDPEVSFHPAAPLHSVPTMFMPYIEGPKMNCDCG